jgi:hypothetical protein
MMEEQVAVLNASAVLLCSSFGIPQPMPCVQTQEELVLFRYMLSLGHDLMQVVYAGDHRMTKLPKSSPPLALYMAVPAALPGRLAWMAPLRNTTPVARGKYTR